MSWLFVSIANNVLQWYKRITWKILFSFVWAISISRFSITAPSAMNWRQKRTRWAPFLYFVFYCFVDSKRRKTFCYTFYWRRTLKKFPYDKQTQTEKKKNILDEKNDMKQVERRMSERERRERKQSKLIPFHFAFVVIATADDDVVAFVQNIIQEFTTYALQFRL